MLQNGPKMIIVLEGLEGGSRVGPVFSSFFWFLQRKMGVGGRSPPKR